MKILLPILNLLFPILMFAGRPTQQADSLRGSDIHCNAMTLTWNKGNGSACIVLAREGAAVNYTPVDGTVYLPSSVFGNSTAYGSGNYVVYNGTGTSFRLSGLNPGKTYHLAVYGHDNNGSLTEYLIAGAPNLSIKTFNIAVSFTTLALDSCENSNLFRFVNTSVSDIPGIAYEFNFGNGSSTLNQVDWHLKGNGLLPVYLNPKTTLGGCPSGVTKYVKVFQAKMATLDFSALRDSVQCFYNNYFEIKTKPILAKFPMGVTYMWHTGDGDSSEYPTLKKRYQVSGTHDIVLVLTALSNNKPTACKDTLYTRVRVKYNHLSRMQVNEPVQKLKDNLFRFSNFDTASYTGKWYFGDGDSAVGDSASHVYASTGNFTVRYVAAGKNGCPGEATLAVTVLKDSVSTGVQDHNNSVNLQLYPNPAQGGSITLKSKSPVSQMYATDASGKTMPVQFHELSSELYSVQLEGSGLWILRLVFENGTTGSQTLHLKP